MSFPDDLLDVKVEAHLLGEWVDLSDRLLGDQRIDVSHGRNDEASTATPASFTVLLDNRDGMLTPCDPRSDYSPDWDRNARVRISAESHILGWGEASSIVPTWPVGDISSETEPGECFVTVAVSGILRRLSQRAKPLRSAIYRHATAPVNLPHVFDYFPMEDGKTATQLASGIPNGPRRTMLFTNLELAAYSDLAGAAPLATIPTGKHCTWVADRIVGFNAQGTAEAFFAFPSKPTSSECIFRPIDLVTDGDLGRIIVELRYIDGFPSVRARGFNSAGAEIHNTYVDLTDSTTWFTDKPMQIRLDLADSGGSTAWNVSWAQVTGEADTIEGFSGTWGESFGTVVSIAGLANEVPATAAVGHVILHDGLAAGWLIGPDIGWFGEVATTRASRLCGEEGYSLELVVGDDERSIPMGPQRPLPFLTLLKECADADVAILGEQRRGFGLRYWPRRPGTTGSPISPSTLTPPRSRAGPDPRRPADPQRRDGHASRGLGGARSRMRPRSARTGSTTSP